MSYLSSFTNKLQGGNFALAATAGTASLLYLFSSAKLRSIYPKILKAPAKIYDQPYPADVFPNGADLNTPYGTIRYYEFGPEDGKKLLLVHGISMPCPAWSLIAPYLVKAGYRILCFDLFGRGYSDSPQVTHDAALFVSQITLLLAHLPHWDKFDLCGMSLGGPIASHFAHYYPNRVDRLVLLCPAGGTPNADLRPAVKLIRSHVIPNWLLQRLLRFVPILPTPPKGSLPWWQAKYHPGYNFSFTSSLQDGPIFNAQQVHRAVVRDFGSKLRVIWGDKDNVVRMDTAKYFGQIDLAVIPGAGHFIVLTHPEATAQHMLDFLGSGKSN
ncbi:related to 2-hydroxy-6-oxo-6-phenylhexa-2,4-dienoate hydrolase [Melanopsichium pennsylvanicum]|uniref:Related to 2-hydroxy-6-oxo-6-phenylhexa-2,4-dienoate hydrolase n=2 Tax=Melanopsichium pennsylvanicum TaxID=63383 RepID=A0AAJ4XGT7_9BASI|nr:related to 2-hydroxy-6-oxo-6-phenylhexa-2,4-dienoate hydrolase [Melanopsichium pennsylvanicum 4]SNX81805.1 related to 2-hydroxy-6-oxo-6-phenylhexa-2,4-dienoate hydrolase [Melanopsichium pennsylvanicum]